MSRAYWMFQVKKFASPQIFRSVDNRKGRGKEHEKVLCVHSSDLRVGRKSKKRFYVCIPPTYSNGGSIGAGGKREVGNGRWEMGDGERETGNGKREMGNGRWETGGGRWERQEANKAGPMGSALLGWM